jgi:hypothetical protein
MPKRYQRKKEVVEALKTFSSQPISNAKDFVGDSFYCDGSNCYIKTLIGDMKVEVGDYIIKGDKGEFYPCNPVVFESNYEIVEKTSSPLIHITVNMDNKDDSFDAFVERISKGIEAEYKKIYGY